MSVEVWGMIGAGVAVVQDRAQRFVNLVHRKA